MKNRHQAVWIVVFLLLYLIYLLKLWLDITQVLVCIRLVHCLHVVWSCGIIHLSFHNSHVSFLFLSSGYEEMQAQFVWDDKTVRRTFIRKVWTQMKWKRITHVKHMSQRPLSCPPPTGLCHSHGSALCDCGSSWPLHILVTTLVFFFCSSVTLFTSRGLVLTKWTHVLFCLQHTCEVLYSDSSEHVHGFVVSENTSQLMFPPFFTLFCLLSCVLTLSLSFF